MKKQAMLAVLLLVFLVLTTSCIDPDPTISPLAPGGPSARTLTLSLLLAQLISGGLAAVIVFKFLGTPVGAGLVIWLVGALTWTGMKRKEIVRYTAIVLSAGVALAAYGVALAFAFVPDPVSIEGWINLILGMLGTGFTGSQVLHARGRAGKVAAK